MATREQIEAALDGLPDSELDPVLEFIVSRGTNGTDDTYPAVVPSFAGRPATSAELQELLGDLATDGEG